MRTSQFILCTILLGCGGGETSTGEQGGSSTTTSTGGTGGTSSAAGAGGGTSTSTTMPTGGTGGTGGAPCEIPGPVPCGPAIPGYPDPLLSYDPAALNFNALGPLPEEVPTGAGAGWLGPFAQEVTATAVIVIVDTMPGFCTLPDPVRVALWSEDHCGLPADDPNTHAFNTPLADVQQEPLAGTAAVKLTVPLPANITIPFGQSAYAAIIMATSTTCAASFEPQGDSGPRAIWFGRTDADCDGETDAQLGWAFLDQPTDPSVGVYPYDLGFGIVTQ